MYDVSLDHLLVPFDRSWQRKGSCRSYPTEWFFPSDRSPAPPQAKELCRECDVRLECAIFAMEMHIKDGIWGGFNVRQRRSIGLETFKAWKEARDEQRAVFEQEEAPTEEAPVA